MRLVRARSSLTCLARWSGCHRLTGGRRISGLAGLHGLTHGKGLLLLLHGGQGLVELIEAGTQFVEGIVHRLHLAGELLQGISLRALLRLGGLLQGIDGGGDFGHAVGGLLHQVVHDGIALVIGLLHAHDHFLHLLHLGLQGDHVSVDGKSAGHAGKSQHTN